METTQKPYAFSRKVFCEGMRDGVPIALGYFAVSFSLGIAARNAGLTPIQGFFASLFNNASAGEYAAFSLIAAGATYLEVAIITLIANARYLLMSCALAQKFAPGTPFFHRLIIGYDVTDELFGITIARPGYLNPFYTYGAIALAAPAWAMGTALSDFDAGFFPGLDVGQEVDHAVVGVAVKFEVDRHIAVRCCFDLELCRKLRLIGADAVFQVNRALLVFADGDGAAGIGFVQCIFKCFRIGTLEIAEVGNAVAVIEVDGNVAVVAFFRAISGAGLVSQAVQFKVVDFHPAKSRARELVILDFICISCHNIPPPYFNEPLSSRLIRLFISTAYSRGRALDTGSTKPRTSMARASSSLRPRLMR